MQQEKEQRTGSVGEFMRLYSAYIILALGALFFAMKEKIAGGATELAQAQAKTQTVLEKHGECISELKTSDVVQGMEIKALSDRWDRIEKKLDNAINARRGG